ncbi:MAG: intradiol ring-cleavage dioxygenase [Oscillatoriales cyanobacterium RM1_1_9]|nr:intradiol ring-cleavage dioxygenase [Oscillatoriales cyanobacterium RM1_1_9]
MQRHHRIRSSRRRFLQTYPPMLASLALVTCARKSSTVGLSPQAQGLTPTPACGDLPTAALTAGPFYTPNSPQRKSLLEPGIAGVAIPLTGQVLSRNCTPIANSLVDFWQANDQGEYDNNGYTLRGHQFTDAEGRYWLETIVPGIYPGRTRHIHVKVQAANQPILTTQLYLPEEPLNQGDFLFRPELVMTVQNQGNEKQASLICFGCQWLVER